MTYAKILLFQYCSYVRELFTLKEVEIFKNKVICFWYFVYGLELQSLTTSDIELFQK